MRTLTARRLLTAAVVASLAATAAVATAAPSSATPSSATLPVYNPAGAQFTTVAGAKPLSTDKTIPYWHGQFTDPTNATTYGYNMVGTDPASNTASTVPVDVIPLNLVFTGSGGYALNGADVVDRTVNSPVFTTRDYSTTAEVSGATDPKTGVTPVLPGGTLSPGNVGVQYEDAVMRSQFNKTGSSGYHVNLGQPTVAAPVTIKVPANQGLAFQNSGHVPLGLVSISWFSGQIQSLMGQMHVDPTHVPIFLTDNVMLYIGNTSNCCVIGYHGATKAPGNGTGPSGAQGSQQLQTFAYAAYTTPGTFNPSRDPFLRDIHALSHEIAEWGDDPFVNNAVDPWVTPTAPQYGCTSLLETGDPVVGIGFTLPGNTYDTGTFADGFFHPEDEVFLPWFARQDPNTTAQATQSGTGGRYTLMGDLNPYPGFRQPATGC